MNLIDLIKRNDPAVVECSDGIEPHSYRCDKFSMHALRLPAGAVIRLRGIQTFDELQSWPRDWGWAVSPDPASPPNGNAFRVTFSVTFDDDKTRDVAHLLFEQSQQRWWPIRFDWPPELVGATDPVLHIRVADRADSAVFLGVSEVVNIRGPLLEFARGTGIEIGPGMNPQVRPASNVSVRYVERSPVEEWMKLYPKKDMAAVDEEVRALWKHYITGDAQKLENIEDRSLDFIFSNHVFEHLVNPLGTLEVWKHKLKRDGYVIGITPDAHNTFDLRQPLSAESDWIEEWKTHTWNYQQRHYDAWCRYTEPRVSKDSLQERGYSIHAHYYAPESFARLLQIAVERLGFSRFHIRGTRNNKDFGWLLQNGT